ncbi:hypothetical protein KBP53_08070 [Corynebacterium genitalium ATCC 33030]|uniref:MaoC-like protein n=1 Tax=Corynebacterium genitalium ATCC 33030 TaxID=585529 RepID=D7WEH4_9CORY|nr:MaoC/PaaZ C-terminal domain-containing protein [Corynebacterium genitalium]EFK53551.1 MaoC-like protein [Corynebacterium genitalium ATCC 33030]UUA88864.1 hypothetical protein KBP53_08070 [Corynebacterium genitalium ATCC 33030]
MTTAVGKGPEKDPKDDAQQQAEAKAAEVKAEAKQAADKAAAKAEEVKNTVADKVEDAQEKVSATAEEVKADAEAKAEEVKADADANAGAETHNERIASGKTRDFQTLKAVPDLKAINRKIFMGALPVVGETRSAKGDPTSAIQVDGVKIDKNNLAAYTSATGLRLGNEIPPTYFFVLAFPMIMDLMSRPDFPVPAIGAVHVSNVIEQSRTLTVDETYNIRCYGQNLRPHRRGLIVDMITEVTPEGENDVVWRQTSSFLAMGAKFAKDAELAVTTRGEDTGKVLPKPELPEFKPNARWRWNRDNVNAYVDASNDHNPIHTSNVGAKLFGFPAVIAHGMYSAAAVLAPLEGKLPGALRYSVEFVKPVVIPASVALWTIEQGDGSYELQLRGSSKPEKLHLNAEIKAL